MHNHDGRITWLRGDIFDPEGYRDVLKGASGVIYSAGVLLEGDYKSLTRGQVKVDKVFKLLREEMRGRNPLEADPKRPSGYNKINRDGGKDSKVSMLMIAILVAKEARKAGIDKFTFISAADTFPGIPRRYVTSKRYHPSHYN